MNYVQERKPRSNAARNRSRIEWFVAGLLAVLSFTLCVYSVVSERNLVRSVASERLVGQAHAIEGGLLRRLQSARVTLFQIRDAWEAGDRAGSAALLDAFRSLVSGVRRAAIIDRDGRILQSGGRRSGPWIVDADYLRGLGDMKDAEMVYTLALPDPPGDGATLRLTLPVIDGRGEIRHVIMAELGADYFNTLQRMALETDDAWSSLSMADGALLALFANDTQAARAARLWRLDEPEPALRTGPVPGVRILDGVGGPRRLLVQRTVGSSELTLDRPLVLTLSRELEPLDAAWRRLAVVYAVGMAVLVVVAGGMLRLSQIRRARWEDLVHVQDRERVEHAQRMELALEGAFLGLWELSIPDDRMLVDGRSAAIQGYRRGELEARAQDWRADLHPDDAPAFEQQLALHLEGKMSKFEAEYRLRRKEGGWVWGQCLGRVIQRDAKGRPVYLLGT
ncbi:PAS domain-containing protein, partial [Leptospira sp. 96542]|nr:PAS domain-containing protein [Leptospira sp. 96542]